MTTQADTFNYAYYLCVQIVPEGTLFDQKTLVVPYDKTEFNNFNQVFQGYRQLPDTLSNIFNFSEYNIKSLNPYTSFNGILEGRPLVSYKSVDNGNFGEDLQLIFMQVEDTPNMRTSKLLDLNYLPMTKVQFTFFKDFVMPTYKYPMRLWQLKKTLFDLIISNKSSDNNTKTTLFNITNNRDIVQGLERQLYNYAVTSYSVELGLLSEYAGIQLYDAFTAPPIAPTTIVSPPSIVAPSVIKSTSIIINWRIPTATVPTWYGFLIDENLTAFMMPPVDFISINPVFRFDGTDYIISVKATGLTPATSYNIKARIQTGEVVPPAVAGAFSVPVSFTTTAP